MHRGVMIDELHVGVFVTRNLSDQRSAVIRQTLRGVRFTMALRRAVLGVSAGNRSSAASG